nr:hypothetical protein [Tanacetum cinerariifolium]
MARLLISISYAIYNPASNASYSTSLFVDANLKRRAYVCSFSSGLIKINPAPDPSKLEAPLVHRLALLLGVLGNIFGASLRHMGTCLSSLSASSTALMLFFEAARPRGFILSDRSIPYLQVFGFPPPVMVLWILVISAWVHAKISAFDFKRYCNLFLKEGGSCFSMMTEPMAWQTDYCIMKENVHTKRTEIRTWNNSRERVKWKEKTTRSSRTYGMATDYGIMKKKMSILSGRKSVPGMNSRNRG